MAREMQLLMEAEDQRRTMQSELESEKDALRELLVAVCSLCCVDIIVCRGVSS